MGKNKLQRFAESESFSNFIQLTYDEMVKGCPLRGNWNKEFFKNDNPIILELGCGKGEYSIGLARKYPDKNFIGVDIKGARIWRGAKTALDENLTNVGFIRTQIQQIAQFFAANEVSGIWIPFPDPQPRKPKIKKRLTSPTLLAAYRKILKPGAVINLKTDSELLYEYTMEVVQEHKHILLEHSDDVYGKNVQGDVADIRTYYESMWLEEGRKIHLVSFKLNPDE